VNDGQEPAELEGFELRDAGGAVSLPSASLAPGEYLLLVRAAFAPDLELDVSPLRGTRTLELEALGQSGLANGGELLRLSDASGRVLSRFPAPRRARRASASLAVRPTRRMTSRARSVPTRPRSVAGRAERAALSLTRR
jgi:hypothetical protein